MFRLSFRCLFVACIALTTSLATAQLRITPLKAGEKELLTTRTSEFLPTPALVQALQLEVVAPEARRKVREPVYQAALAALEALDEAALTTDFDRAWVTEQTATALFRLGRRDESRTLYERLRTLPHTEGQNRQASVMLHALGNADLLGVCPPGSRLNKDEPVSPQYPKLAQPYGLDGWVWVWVKVERDGRITDVVITSSSRLVFEAPAREWLLTRLIVDAQGQPSGVPCLGRMQLKFASGFPAGRTQRAVPEDAVLDLLSIGAARSALAAGTTEAR